MGAAIAQSVGLSPRIVQRNLQPATFVGPSAATRRYRYMTKGRAAHEAIGGGISQVRAITTLASASFNVLAPMSRVQSTKGPLKHEFICKRIWIV